MRRFAKIITLVAIVAFALMPIFIPSFSVFSQSLIEQELEIVDIDMDNLPGVMLRIKGKNMDDNFVTAPISLEENGVKRPITSEDLSKLGLQIAFVMDPTQNLTAPGNTGDARWFEIASAAGGLVNSSILSAQTDIVSAYGPGEDANDFGQLEGWLRDHQAVVNTLYQYVAAETVNDTSTILLSDALISTLSEFGDEELSASAEKAIILFSDGSQLLETEKVNEIVDLAQELNVQLNVVMLGADTPIPRGNLERLSTGTNGLLEVLNRISDLDPIWEMLQQRRTIREITYNLGSAFADKLDVAIDLPSGEKFATAITYPEFEISPATVSIVSPLESEKINFDLSDDDMTESELAVPVVLSVEWPDDREREFLQIEYLIDDALIAQEDSLSSEFMLALANVENGEHTLSIVATDSLGVETMSSPRNFSLDVTGAELAQAQLNSTSTTTATQPDDEESATIELTSDANSDTTINSTESAPEPVTVSAASDAIVSATLSSSSTEATNAAIDAAIQNTPTENTVGAGMNLFGLELPPSVDIFGFEFFINPFTLLLLALPLIFALALLTYWLSERSATPRVAYNNDYEFYDTGQVATIENNVFFEDDGQLQVTQPEIGVIDIEDDITEPVKVPSFYTTAPAYLVYVSGGNHLPKKLPVEGGEPIRIGRKKSFCELVLDDRRVSRLHSVITLADDRFYIRDEGSSGGTFVNRRKLGTVDNQELNHHDIINFNEVEYRFESTAEQADEETNDSSAFAAPFRDTRM